MKKEMRLTTNLEVEVSEDRVILYKEKDGKLDCFIGVDVADLEKILEQAYAIKNKQVIYDTPRKGIEVMWGEPVEVIGEQQVEHDGRILEQYLYNKIGYSPKNGKPFVSLKSNISVEGK